MKVSLKWLSEYVDEMCIRDSVRGFRSNLRRACFGEGWLRPVRLLAPLARFGSSICCRIEVLARWALSIEKGSDKTPDHVFLAVTKPSLQGGVNCQKLDFAAYFNIGRRTAARRTSASRPKRIASTRSGSSCFRSGLCCICTYVLRKQLDMRLGE